MYGAIEGGRSVLVVLLNMLIEQNRREDTFVSTLNMEVQALSQRQ
jgi:hypothetical protein